MTLLAGDHKDKLMQNEHVASGWIFNESHDGNDFTEM